MAFGRGLAGSNVTITDETFLESAGVRGAVGVLGETERGPVGQPTLISTWTEYVRIFGGFQEHTTNLFPLLCYRALQGGATLRVSRVIHYDDVADTSSATGVVASATAGVLALTADNVGSWANDIKVQIQADPNVDKQFCVAFEVRKWVL